MSETNTETPVIKVASVTYRDGLPILRMEDESRTSVEFALDPLALALMSITMQPVLRLALEDMKRKHPEEFEGPGVPDSPEGL